MEYAAGAARRQFTNSPIHSPIHQFTNSPISYSILTADFLSKENRMMRIVVAVVVALGFGAQGVSTGVHVWKATDIAAKGKELGQKLDAQKVANEVLATEGNRRFMVAHREGSGQAEWHEKEADVMFISAGAVTMMYGGTIVDEKVTAAGERRGSAIKGGTPANLVAGDVLHIPAKVPHQMILAPGAQVTYFVTKVVE